MFAPMLVLFNRGLRYHLCPGLLIVDGRRHAAQHLENTIPVVVAPATEAPVVIPLAGKVPARSLVISPQRTHPVTAALRS
jgi:hypothetical protein